MLCSSYSSLFLLFDLCGGRTLLTLMNLNMHKTYVSCVNVYNFLFTIVRPSTQLQLCQISCIITRFRLFFFPLFPNLAEQFLISAAATDFDSSVPWLWTLHQSGNPCHLGAVDRCWLKFSLFPCNTQSNRSIARWIGHFMGGGRRFRSIFPKEILSKLFEWKQVRENHCSFHRN